MKVAEYGVEEFSNTGEAFMKVYIITDKINSLCYIHFNVEERTKLKHAKKYILDILHCRQDSDQWFPWKMDMDDGLPGSSNGG